MEGPAGRHDPWAESQALQFPKARGSGGPEPPCTRGGSAAFLDPNVLPVSGASVPVYVPFFLHPAGFPPWRLHQSPVFWRGLLCVSSTAQRPGRTPLSAVLGCTGASWKGTLVHRAPSFLRHPLGPLDAPVVCTARLCIGSSRVLSACYGTFLDHRLRSLCLQAACGGCLYLNQGLMHHLDPRRLMHPPKHQPLMTDWWHLPRPQREGFDVQSPWESLH